jgi:sulfoxide reductase heme-binding subunit YedZ
MFAAALKYVPWIGPDTRASPLKLVVFVALFLPGLWVAFALDQGLLGAARPLNQATREIGLWTIRLLLLSLAITPLRQILRWPELILTRRMIGVAAFAYVLIHLFLYTADEKYNLLKVVSEIYLRTYLTIGFTALIGLAVLAVTSTDRMIARLGGKAWRRLHWLIYPIAVLIVHLWRSRRPTCGNRCGWLACSRPRLIVSWPGAVASWPPCPGLPGWRFAADLPSAKRPTLVLMRRSAVGSRR